MTIDVVIMDDQELVRTGLRMVLSKAPDIEVAGPGGAADVPSETTFQDGRHQRRRRAGRPPW